jgi:hypothetical protein
MENLGPFEEETIEVYQRFREELKGSVEPGAIALLTIASILNGM